MARPSETGPRPTGQAPSGLDASRFDPARVIEIEWLSDQGPNCETCGTSYAHGALVKIGGETLLHAEPVAHCFNGRSWEQDEIYRLILEELGYVVRASK